MLFTSISPLLYIDSITGLECCKRNHCSTSYAYGSGTTTSKIHLKKEHKIDITDRNELKQATYNDNIITALSRQPALEEGRKTRQLTEHLAQSMNKKSLEYLYPPLQWLGSWRKSQQSWKMEKHDGPEEVQDAGGGTDAMEVKKGTEVTELAVVP